MCSVPSGRDRGDLPSFFWVYASPLRLFVRAGEGRYLADKSYILLLLLLLLLPSLLAVWSSSILAVNTKNGDSVMHKARAIMIAVGVVVVGIVFTHKAHAVMVVVVVYHMQRMTRAT